MAIPPDESDFLEGYRLHNFDPNLQFSAKLPDWMERSLNARPGVHVETVFEDDVPYHVVRRDGSRFALGTMLYDPASDQVVVMRDRYANVGRVLTGALSFNSATGKTSPTPGRVYKRDEMFDLFLDKNIDFWKTRSSAQGGLSNAASFKSRPDVVNRGLGYVSVRMDKEMTQNVLTGLRGAYTLPSNYFDLGDDFPIKRAFHDHQQAVIDQFRRATPGNWASRHNTLFDMSQYYNAADTILTLGSETYAVSKPKDYRRFHRGNTLFIDRGLSPDPLYSQSGTMRGRHPQTGFMLTHTFIDDPLPFSEGNAFVPSQYQMVAEPTRLRVRGMTAQQLRAQGIEQGTVFGRSIGGEQVVDPSVLRQVTGFDLGNKQQVVVTGMTMDGSDVILNMAYRTPFSDATEVKTLPGMKYITMPMGARHPFAPLFADSDLIAPLPQKPGRLATIAMHAWMAQSPTAMHNQFVSVFREFDQTTPLDQAVGYDNNRIDIRKGYEQFALMAAGRYMESLGKSATVKNLPVETGLLRKLQSTMGDDFAARFGDVQWGEQTSIIPEYRFTYYNLNMPATVLPSSRSGRATFSTSMLNTIAQKHPDVFGELQQRYLLGESRAKDMEILRAFMPQTHRTTQPPSLPMDMAELREIYRNVEGVGRERMANALRALPESHIMTRINNRLFPSPRTLAGAISSDNPTEWAKGVYGVLEAHVFDDRDYLRYAKSRLATGIEEFLTQTDSRKKALQMSFPALTGKATASTLLPPHIAVTDPRSAIRLIRTMTHLDDDEKKHLEYRFLHQGGVTALVTAQQTDLFTTFPLVRMMSPRQAEKLLGYQRGTLRVESGMTTYSQRLVGEQNRDLDGDTMAAVLLSTLRSIGDLESALTPYMYEGRGQENLKFIEKVVGAAKANKMIAGLGQDPAQYKSKFYGMGKAIRESDEAAYSTGQMQQTHPPWIEVMSSFGVSLLTDLGVKDKNALMRTVSMIGAQVYQLAMDQTATKSAATKAVQDMVDRLTLGKNQELVYRADKPDVPFKRGYNRGDYPDIARLALDMFGMLGAMEISPTGDLGDDAKAYLGYDQYTGMADALARGLVPMRDAENVDRIGAVRTALTAMYERLKGTNPEKLDPESVIELVSAITGQAYSENDQAVFKRLFKSRNLVGRLSERVAYGQDKGNFAQISLGAGETPPVLYVPGGVNYIAPASLAKAPQVKGNPIADAVLKLMTGFGGEMGDMSFLGAWLYGGIIENSRTNFGITPERAEFGGGFQTDVGRYYQAAEFARRARSGSYRLSATETKGDVFQEAEALGLSESEGLQGTAFMLEVLAGQHDDVAKARHALALADRHRRKNPIHLGKPTPIKMRDREVFADGGYTGHGNKYAPAGIVHKGEYVINQELVAAIRRGKGEDVLHYIERDLASDTLKFQLGYAHGGEVWSPDDMARLHSAFISSSFNTPLDLVNFMFDQGKALGRTYNAVEHQLRNRYTTAGFSQKDVGNVFSAVYGAHAGGSVGRPAATPLLGAGSSDGGSGLPPVSPPPGMEDLPPKRVPRGFDPNEERLIRMSMDNTGKRGIEIDVDGTMTEAMEFIRKFVSRVDKGRARGADAVLDEVMLSDIETVTTQISALVGTDLGRLSAADLETMQAAFDSAKVVDDQLKAMRTVGEDNAPLMNRNEMAQAESLLGEALQIGEAIGIKPASRFQRAQRAIEASDKADSVVANLDMTTINAQMGEFIAHLDDLDGILQGVNRGSDAFVKQASALVGFADRIGSVFEKAQASVKAAAERGVEAPEEARQLVEMMSMPVRAGSAGIIPLGQALQMPEFRAGLAREQARRQPARDDEDTPTEKFARRLIGLTEGLTYFQHSVGRHIGSLMTEYGQMRAQTEISQLRSAGGMIAPGGVTYELLARSAAMQNFRMGLGETLFESYGAVANMAGGAKGIPATAAALGVPALFAGALTANALNSLGKTQGFERLSAIAGPVGMGVGAVAAMAGFANLVASNMSAENVAMRELNNRRYGSAGALMADAGGWLGAFALDAGGLLNIGDARSQSWGGMTLGALIGANMPMNQAADFEINLGDGVMRPLDTVIPRAQIVSSYAAQFRQRLADRGFGFIDEGQAGQIFSFLGRFGDPLTGYSDAQIEGLANFSVLGGDVNALSGAAFAAGGVDPYRNSLVGAGITSALLAETITRLENGESVEEIQSTMTSRFGLQERVRRLWETNRVHLRTSTERLQLTPAQIEQALASEVTTNATLDVQSVIAAMSGISPGGTGFNGGWLDGLKLQALNPTLAPYAAASVQGLSQILPRYQQNVARGGNPNVDLSWTSLAGTSPELFARLAGVYNGDPYSIAATFGAGSPLSIINPQTGMDAYYGGISGAQIAQLRQRQGAWMRVDNATLTGGAKAMSAELVNMQYQMMHTQRFADLYQRTYTNQIATGSQNLGNVQLAANGMVTGGSLSGMNVLAPNFQVGNGMTLWQVEDAMVNLQRQQQQFGLMQQGQSLGLAQQQFALTGSQFYERWGLSQAQLNYNTQYQAGMMQFQRGMQVEQFQWQSEDLAYNRAQLDIGYGWQMEDFDREIRFARGRQKRDLMRQQRRASIQYAMQSGQQDRQEDRFEQQKKWAEELFEKEKANFEQQTQFAQQELEMQKRHFEEGRQLEQQRLQMQALAHQMQIQWLNEEHGLQDQQRLLARQQYLDLGSMAQNTQDDVYNLNLKMQDFQVTLQGTAQMLAEINALYGTPDFGSNAVGQATNPTTSSQVQLTPGQNPNGYSGNPVNGAMYTDSNGTLWVFIGGQWQSTGAGSIGGSEVERSATNVAYPTGSGRDNPESILLLRRIAAASEQIAQNPTLFQAIVNGTPAAAVPYQQSRARL